MQKQEELFFVYDNDSGWDDKFYQECRTEDEFRETIKLECSELDFSEVTPLHELGIYL